MEYVEVGGLHVSAAFLELDLRHLKALLLFSISAFLFHCSHTYSLLEQYVYHILTAIRYSEARGRSQFSKRAFLSL